MSGKKWTWKSLPGHDEDTGLEYMFWRLEIPHIQWVLEVDPEHDGRIIGDRWLACAKPFTNDEVWWDIEWFGHAPTAEEAKKLAVDWMKTHLHNALEQLEEV